MPSLHSARQYLNDGDYAAAREIAEAALRESPGNREVLALLRDLSSAERQLVIVDTGQPPAATVDASANELPPSFEDEIVQQAAQIFKGMTPVIYAPLVGVVITVIVIAFTGIYLLFWDTATIVETPSGVAAVRIHELVAAIAMEIFGGLPPVVLIGLFLVLAYKIIAAVVSELRNF